ncbi:hypothetical protein [Roseimarinus sediminis]|jgi:hypothetical protein|uniref:hypothetical protein n=1 Tax=Roseimarinus sediminis TaxID=1610899 RepID=UPI003D1E7C56
MEKEVIFEHPRLRLTYYPQLSCILETWDGFTDFDLFVELLDKTLHLMVEKGAKNLILDTRLHKGLNPKGNEHGANACLAHAKEHGPMKHAIIVPSYIFSQMSVDNFVKNVDSKSGSSLVVNKHFQDLDSALAWMKA